MPTVPAFLLIHMGQSMVTKAKMSRYQKRVCFRISPNGSRSLKRPPNRWEHCHRQSREWIHQPGYAQHPRPENLLCASQIVERGQQAGGSKHGMTRYGCGATMWPSTEGLAIFGPRPSLSQMASTRATVARSIFTTSGHSRSWPSEGHLRVASIPIFEP
jgi:hypothetical protein